MKNENENGNENGRKGSGYTFSSHFIFIPLRDTLLC
jgi:hypothetical protein